MNQSPSWYSSFWFQLVSKAVSLFLAGFGIGWLIGLAVSPVVAAVVVSIVGAATALVASMSGLETANQEDKPTPNVVTQIMQVITPVPLGLLLLGVVCGTIGGMGARTGNWFGSEVSNEIHKWTRVSNLSEEELALRLLDLRYPPTPTSTPLPMWMAEPGLTNSRPSVIASLITTTFTTTVQSIVTQTLTATVTTSTTSFVSKSITTTFPLTLTSAEYLLAEVQQWEAVGLARTEVARQLFERKYPARASSLSNSPPPDQLRPTFEGDPTAKSALLGLTGSECSRLGLAKLSGQAQFRQDLLATAGGKQANDLGIFDQFFVVAWNMLGVLCD